MNLKSLITISLRAYASLISCSDVNEPILKPNKEISITGLPTGPLFPITSPPSSGILVVQDVYEKSHIYEIKLDSSYSSIRANKLSSFYKQPLNFHELFYKNEDSLFGFYNDSKALVVKGGGRINFPLPLNPVSSPQLPLSGADSRIAIANGSNYGDAYLNYKELIQFPPILLYDLKEKSSNPIGSFPKAYIENETNFYDYSPKVTFTTNSLVYAFGADHFVSKYQEGFGNSVYEVKSKFIEHFNKYPQNKMFDMVFMQNYMYEEPRYINIIHDPFKDLFYRVVKHRNKHMKGKPKTPSKWSLMVLDNEFSLLTEVEFDLPYSSQIIIPSEDGLYIKRFNQDSEDLTLTLFNLYYE